MPKHEKWQDLTVEHTHWSNLQTSEWKERKSLKPLTPGQALYMEAIRTNSLIICTGPAGTGKTYLPSMMAAEALREGKTSRIVLSRPLVTCGAGLGYLPGHIDEKVAPYMRPLLDIVHDELNFEQRRLVEMWPLETMRGATLKDCWVIADECQNAIYSQLFMLLTRIGTNCKMILSGDAHQLDLPGKFGNPFLDIIRKLKDRGGYQGVSFIELTSEDIVRHGLVRWIFERLGTGPDDAKREEELNGLTSWVSFLCPCCQSRCHFDEYSQNWVSVVRCWQCHSHVLVPDDLSDSDGFGIVKGGRAVESYPVEV